MRDLQYEEHQPHPGLRPEVRCLWRAVIPPSGAATPPWLRVLPDGCTDIVVDYVPSPGPRGRPAGAIGVNVVGTMTRAAPFCSTETVEVLGLRFNPGGASAFLRVPARELTDTSVALTEFWHGDAAELAARLAEIGTVRERLAAIEALALRRLRPVGSGAWCALRIAQLIAAEAGGIRVGELAERTGFSRQYLARLFDEHIGIAPKLFARIERFSAIVERAESGGTPGGWADAAVAHGYYDQSHFVHEFAEFAGVTPLAYFGRG